MAMPGKYTVRLKTPTTSEERPLELIPDPLAPSLDYGKRKETIGTMFGMVEELGFLEGRVRALRDSTQQRTVWVKNKGTKAKLTKYAEQLDAFHKTLTETIESRGITGEEKLRARVGRIYVTTVFTDQPPTESTLKRMLFLQEELKRVQALADGHFKQLANLNNDLKKEKLGALRILDKEAFLKAYDAPAAMTKSGLMELMKE